MTLGGITQKPKESIMKTVMVPYELLHDIGSYLSGVKPAEFPEQAPEHHAAAWRLRMLGRVQNLLFPDSDSEPDSEPHWNEN